MPTPAPRPLPARNHTLLAGITLQACLGSVYAWSYFQKPLCATYGWSNGQVSLVFSLAIGCLGLTAAFAGAQLPRWGFRKPALIGAACFALGHLVAALALHLHSHTLLCLGYGVIGGIGLGLGYVSSVAAAAARYPEKKGLATGLVVMGFGLGALVMSKVLAPLALRVTGGALPPVFLCFGLVFLAIATLAAARIHATAPAKAAATESPAATGPGPGTFATIWGVFFLNSLAGLGILAFQSGLMQDLCRAADPTATSAALEAAGATLIAISAVANGAGRFIWGGLSDKIGRANTFLLLLATQAVVFVLLPFVSSPILFACLISYVLCCYGGGFGTMPALVGDTFGPARMGTLYGRMLTAWAAAGILGPLLLAKIKDAYPAAEAARLAFFGGASVLALGFGLALTLRARPQAGATVPVKA